MFSPTNIAKKNLCYGIGRIKSEYLLIPYTFFDKGLAFHIHNIRSGLKFCFSISNDSVSISNDSDGSEAKKGNAAFLFPQHFVPLQ